MTAGARVTLIDSSGGASRASIAARDLSRRNPVPPQLQTAARRVPHRPRGRRMGIELNDALHVELS